MFLWTTCAFVAVKKKSILKISLRYIWCSCAISVVITVGFGGLTATRDHERGRERGVERERERGRKRGREPTGSLVISILAEHR